MGYRPVLAPLQTGQTVSYTAGDDGQHQAGRIYPSVRFVDVGTNLVIDRHTGLMWVKQPTAIVPNTSLAATTPRGTWQSNIAYVQSDFTKDETTTASGVASGQTYVGGGVYELTASSGTFTAQDVGRRIYRVADGRYGSIVTFISTTKVKFGVDSDGASIPWFNNGDAWDVRDFEGIFVCSLAVNSATRPNNDPTHWIVFDWNITADSLNDPKKFNWDGALTTCAGLTYGGFNDWRLPNLNELLSVIDFGVASQPYAQGVTVVSGGFYDYWSSTTRASSTTAAMTVSFVNPGLGSWMKTSVGAIVLPVRGGLIHG